MASAPRSASTTNTDLKERETIDPTDLDPNGYVCTQTNFDSHLKYSKLDAWAKFPDFQTRVRDALLKRQALDRICIGFNGVSRAATSDRVANPLLQDVNKGWLQKYREQAPARVMDHGKTAAKSSSVPAATTRTSTPPCTTPSRACSTRGTRKTRISSCCAAARWHTRNTSR
ncbi:phage major capsid protein, P2 family [Pandoraea pnomenusa]|uniref:Phage major capsid protein, P2 family n=1 Tax=Pandoraea pnomenusa TaxID=93220 RepID=A0A379KEC6_9BURK|nr:phage major capsid protein, P2 family [Pandoraea pnomenusa]